MNLNEESLNDKNIFTVQPLNTVVKHNGYFSQNILYFNIKVLVSSSCLSNYL